MSSLVVKELRSDRSSIGGGGKLLKTYTSNLTVLQHQEPVLLNIFFVVVIPTKYYKLLNNQMHAQDFLLSPVFSTKNHQTIIVQLLSDLHSAG